AQRGTIFLDEIGEMSLATQAKLLRVLQEKEFERIGGTETIKADVRILAATNRNLEQAIQSGQFREDLFFRLNVVEVWLPPLREHREDIPILADHFVRQAAREHRKEVLGFSGAALDLLLRYDWPGNIRELKNLCERCVLLAGGPLIDVGDLPGNVRDRARQAEAPARELSLKEAVADTERRLLLEALEKHNWNRSAAAKALKMNRSTLYAKMKELGLL
ncbi:MAG: sigma 54-interacting transcriptional regulator, partial [Firmicutes bacterium]|nr:sigma 54-interacting transcriptional regulator [Bacillota bacterium]